MISYVDNVFFASFKALEYCKAESHDAMDQTEKSSEQGAREFDFRFVIEKDEEVKGEDGNTHVVKSEVVASRLKVIAKGGEGEKKERLVFDMQTGKLVVESEPDSARPIAAAADRQVIEDMASSGWFACRISST